MEGMLWDGRNARDGSGSTCSRGEAPISNHTLQIHSDEHITWKWILPCDVFVGGYIQISKTWTLHHRQSSNHQLLTVNICFTVCCVYALVLRIQPGLIVRSSPEEPRPSEPRTGRAGNRSSHVARRRLANPRGPPKLCEQLARHSASSEARHSSEA